MCPGNSPPHGRAIPFKETQHTWSCRTDISSSAQQKALLNQETQEAEERIRNRVQLHESLQIPIVTCWGHILQMEMLFCFFF
jgi:hypothetical protein